MDFASGENKNASAMIILRNMNSTSFASNMTEIPPCFHLHLTEEVKALLIVAYVFIFIVGTVGNIVAIYVIGVKNKATKRCFDIQIVGLAVADLIAAITLPVVTIHDFVLDWSDWQLGGTFGCKIFVSIDHVTMLVSTFILILISTDRLRAIGSLRMISNTSTMVRFEIFIIWCIAISIVSPYMNTLSVKQGVCHSWDWTPIQLFTYYAVYVNLSSFIPAALLICVYSKSIYMLSQKEIPGSEDKRFNARRRKEFLRIMKMFCCIATLFFVLTMPHMVVHFITSYYGTFDIMKFCENSKLLMTLQYGFYTLSHFNCCVNPFIYAKMHTNMKRSLVKHISSRWKAFTLTREISLSVASMNSNTEHQPMEPMVSFTGSPNLTVYKFKKDCNG